ncbi:DUF4013 domain-containing protein [Candidatus Bathyarchaeota archaeon]|nr:DUF4013 domain-containing protein [Candidatus Bathyarchaeota archaeon]
MNLDENFSDSAGYAKKMFTYLGRLLILIVLNFIPIVNFIVEGYMWRVVHSTPSSKDPPQLEHYGEMWVNGLKIVVVSLIYMIIPIIIILFGTWELIVRTMIHGLQLRFLTITGIIAIFIGIVLAFLLSIILAMGIVHMIKHNNFGKAFAFREILSIIKKIGWGKYMAWLAIVFIVMMVVHAISRIPGVGWLISIVITPVFYVFVSRSAALIYCDGAPELSAPTMPLTPRPLVPKPPEFIYCPICGEKLQEGANYCPKCGYKL